MGKVSAVIIKTIKIEYLATPKRSYMSLSTVLANNGGNIRKYPRVIRMPQISRNIILSGNPVFKNFM